MRIHTKHYGIVEGGVKKYYQPDLYRKQLDALEGRRFVEVIQEVKQKPSVDTHAYYRGGILPTCYSAEMFAHFDNKDQIHELYFAPKFLSFVQMVVLPNEKYEVRITRSLSDLSQKEMNEFIEKVKADCAVNGTEVLEPSDYYDKIYNKKI